MTPFPVYPWLQVQVKLPGVLVQLALVSQLSVLAVHSLMSKYTTELARRGADHNLTIYHSIIHTEL